MKTIFKTSFLVLSFTVFLQNCNSPITTAGNGSVMDGTRGGGDPNKINQAAVELLLQGDGLKVAMLNYLNVIPVDQVSDTYVKSTLTRITANQALVNDIQTSGNYTIGTDCKDAYSNSVPASTIIGDIGGKICFNSAQIAADIENLGQEDGMIRLAALAFHEHVHHFQNASAGATVNEAEAYQFAAYVQLTAKVGQIPVLTWNEPNTALNILVNAPAPAPQRNFGDVGYTLYFAATGTSGGILSPSIGADGNSYPEYYDESDGYRLIDLTDPNALIYVDVSVSGSIATSGNQIPVVTIGTGEVIGNEIPIFGASVVDQTIPNQAPTLCSQSSNCLQGPRNSQLEYISAIYSPGSTMRLSFRVADLCNTSGVQTGATSICASAGVINTAGFNGTASFSQLLVVSVSWADPTGASGMAAQTGSLTSGIQGSVATVVDIDLTDIAPTISRPTDSNIENFYSPADGAVNFTAEHYQPLAGLLDNGAPVAGLVVLADRSKLPAISSNALPTYDVSAKINSKGDSLVQGFANSVCTSGICSNGYNAAIYSVNSAGIFSLGAGITTPFITGQGVFTDGLLHAAVPNSSNR